MVNPVGSKYKKISISKQKRVARLYQEGVSITELSRLYDLPKSSIYNWGHKYRASPYSIKVVMTRELNTLKRTVSRTARELEICQQCLRRLMLSPKTKYAFMDDIYGRYSLYEICEAMEVSRGAYYNHLRAKNKVGQQETRRAMLMEEILAIYDASAHRYGAGRIVEALQQRGIKTSDKTVRELMRELGIGLHPRRPGGGGVNCSVEVGRALVSCLARADTPHRVPVAPVVIAGTQATTIVVQVVPVAVTVRGSRPPVADGVGIAERATVVAPTKGRRESGGVASNTTHLTIGW